MTSLTLTPWIMDTPTHVVGSLDPISQQNHSVCIARNLHDAALICAAPDLLTAIKRLAFAAECRDNTMGDVCRLIEVKAELASAASQARAAIAKAGGVA